MKEPFIRIGNDGTEIDRGGWEQEIPDTTDSESSNNNNTPMPDVREHNFERDRIETERRDIVFIIDNPFIRPLN